MNYPEWAPKLLIDWHKKIISSDEGSGGRDPESIVAKMVKNHELKISDENIENVRRQLYRSMLPGIMPKDDEISMLEKLITDKNMKSVWSSLSKRYKDEDQEQRNFYFACQRGITGWRGDQKQTGVEKREFYQEIYDTVANLQSLMQKASAFDNLSICELIQDESIEWVRETLEMPDIYSAGKKMEVNYVRFCLSEVLPSVDDCMAEIARIAKKNRDDPVLIKKPNSQNAGAHYFINILSHYCSSVYGQPLHQVVAITTSVIFFLENCDEAYVRKIVKA